jgi:FkbM family methyltransferase
MSASPLPETIARDFFRALDRLHQRPWRKLLDPGPIPFIQRRLARAASAPVRRDARLFFGASMHIVLPEVISEQIHSYGLFDDVVTWMAICAIEPGDKVFDVGAHFGYFTLLFAALSGRDGSVHSFEPTPSTFRVLASNAAGDGRIHLLNAAAGSAPGRLVIADHGIRYSAWNTLAADGRLDRSAAGAQPAGVEVEVQTLDAVSEASGVTPQFIKIDAENFEPEVLRGAARLVGAARPTLLLEAGSERMAEVASSLASAGYRAFSTLEPGRLLEMPDAASAARQYKDVLFCADARADQLLERAGRLAAMRAPG